MAAKTLITNNNVLPIVSKVYCAPSEVVLAVRRRPNVANGGGFAVADSTQRVVFSVDGCGVLGKKQELILRDGDGNALLLIRRKGAIVEALNLTRKWKGYSYVDLVGSDKLVFTLKEPNSSCFSTNARIKISIESKELCSHGSFEVLGDFPGRSCTIVSPMGDVIGVNKELQRLMASRDMYQVEIKAGFDQAFVFGVIAVLDYIYDGSTRC
ncbi:LURP-one-like protein [Perilla frutescens var. hirtella]|uniref:LURP-one-like protein n=1 Tax=Perilla frutescens var. hirtella TaxID=608512 RepID=A0AAD4J8I1_PERFH|nr:LURP-one-like protein [Perilla frutescens var. hirtella]